MEVNIIFFGIPLLLAAAAGTAEFFILTRIKRKGLRRGLAALLPAGTALLTGWMLWKSEHASGIFMAGLVELIYALWAGSAFGGTALGGAAALWRARKKRTKEDTP